MKEMIKYKIADIGVYVSAWVIIFFYISSTLEDILELYSYDYMIIFIMFLSEIAVFILILFLFYQAFHRVSTGCVFGVVTQAWFAAGTVSKYSILVETDIFWSIYIAGMIFTVFAMPFIFVLAEIVNAAIKIANKRGIMIENKGRFGAADLGMSFLVFASAFFFLAYL